MNRRRILSLILLAWALGFGWFALILPQPAGAGAGKADAVVVLTGGAGRVERGLDVLDQHWAPLLFVSGVDKQVKLNEFAVQFNVPSEQMACCVRLGYSAVDTVSNARETADWIRGRGLKTIRLVTSDWHMRRAAFELRRTVPTGVTIIEDAVPTKPSLRILFIEYHKLLAREIARVQGG